MLAELLILLLLIAANGVLSGAEIAIVSVRKTASALLEEARAGARALATLRHHPERFLATVQIGITVVSVTAGTFGGAAVAAHLEALLRPLAGSSAHDLALGTVVAGISYCTLVLGELVPKSLALRASERYALWVAPLLRGLSWIMRPLVWLLTRSSNLVLRPFADRTNFTETRLSRDELSDLVDEAAETGALDEKTSELASRALHLGELTAADVMVPPPRIVALPRDATHDMIRAQHVVEHDQLALPHQADLVGELFSENNPKGDPIIHEPSGALLVRGTVTIRDVSRALGDRAPALEQPAGLTTLGGLCSHLAGGIVPQPGARLASEAGPLLVVVDATRRAVTRVRVIAPAAAPGPPAQ